ncbi:MAG: hypothetical protein OEZ68_19560 [Gammaproteobacteria bacterium]|nr:hypothetical protein [Gammaproteobacteria bacterium]MDH5803007.1 hypothetical protein [Gammaproteobacteria bacterium]
MNMKLTVMLTGIIMGSMSLSAPVFAGNSDAIMKMAEIMQRLKHFPSPDGKKTLQDIISSSTASNNERVLATAMLNLNHQADGADKPKLEAIINGKAADSEKTLAQIIINLDHRPSGADKEQLAKLLK